MDITSVEAGAETTLQAEKSYDYSLEVSLVALVWMDCLFTS